MPRDTSGINHDALHQRKVWVSSWSSLLRPQAEGDEVTAEARALPGSRGADGAARPPRGAGGGVLRVPHTALLALPRLIVAGGSCRRAADLM